MWEQNRRRKLHLNGCQATAEMHVFGSSCLTKGYQLVRTAFLRILLVYKRSAPKVLVAHAILIIVETNDDLGGCLYRLPGFL